MYIDIEDYSNIIRTYKNDKFFLKVFDQVKASVNLFLQRGELYNFWSTQPQAYFRAGDPEYHYEPSDSLEAVFYVRSDIMGELSMVKGYSIVDLLT